MFEPNWDQPNPADLTNVSGPPLPDTETLLAEVHAGYPAVSYPAAQEESEDEESVDRAIMAGLTWP
jgi:hypothetical protein